MDEKREKQLRRDAFIVMTQHLRLINGGAVLRLSDIMRVLKVSRPTARAFAVSLYQDGKAYIRQDEFEPMEVIIRFGEFTDKDLERSERAYKELIWEMVQ